MNERFDVPFRRGPFLMRPYRHSGKLFTIHDADSYIPHSEHAQLGFPGTLQ
jgi:hypothetical protein